MYNFVNSATATTCLLAVLTLLGCSTSPVAGVATPDTPPTGTTAPEPAAMREREADAVPYPAGVVGERGRELIDVLNTGDAASIDAFLARRFTAGFPPGGSVQAFQAWILDTHDQHPALELRYVTDASDAGATLYTKSMGNHSWLRIRYRLHAGAPHSLADVWFDPSSEPDPVLLVHGDKPLDGVVRKRIVAKINSVMAEHYLFPDVASAAGQFLDASVVAGKYQAATSLDMLAEQLTADLQAATHDKHVIVAATGAGGRKAPAKPREPLPGAHNFGIVEAKVLRGNIGYMELTSFAPAERSADAIATSMRLLEDTDALIFDLRRNGGGARTGVENLMSYLLPAKTHTHSFVSNRGQKVEKSWTLDDVRGKRRLTVPVFVLTSKRSFSAAEAFSYNLQALERATVVGEATGGGAHAGPWIDIMPGLTVLVPHGRAVNPVTNSNWQGAGVQPDVQVESSLALERARQLAALAASKHRRANNPESRRP